MSRHKHRRRRSSGFDLVRLYEDEHHCLDELLHEKRHILAGWGVLASAGAFALLLALAVMGRGLWKTPEPSAFRSDTYSNLPKGAAYITYPPNAVVEELGSDGGPVPGAGPVALLVVLAGLIAGAAFLASGRGEATQVSGEGSAIPQSVAEPSAFARRLDEVVCIKVSRRPPSRRQRHDD